MPIRANDVVQRLEGIAVGVKFQSEVRSEFGVELKPLQISRDIVPLGEFKTHASKALLRVRESQRPLVITQNGKPAAVVLSPEEYDRLTEREQFVAAVRYGLADSEAGRVVDDGEMERELRRQLRPSE